MSNDSRKQTLNTIDSLKEKVTNYVKKLLSDSERSGNTPTKTDYINILNNYFTEELKKETYAFSTEEIGLIKNDLQNYNNTTMIQKYDLSLNSNPREINGKTPIEVTNDWLSDAKKRLSNIEKELSKKIKQTLEDSIKTNKTPSSAQFLAYLQTEVERLIAEQGDSIDEQCKIYLMSYATKYSQDEGATAYNTSLMNNPRKITNDFPWTTDKNTNGTNNGNNTIIKPVTDFYNYNKTNQSFSGCDIVCSIDIILPDGKKVVQTIGSLQTIAYSIYQNKKPVRSIGNMNAIDYVFGQRTIAGTLIFAVFNKHWAYDIIDKYKIAGSTNAHFLMDELPPFHITVSIANEYGYSARLALYNVRIVSEGQTMSVNDIYTENTYQFVATDIDYLADITGIAIGNNNKNDNLPSINAEIGSQIVPALPVKTEETEDKEQSPSVEDEESSSDPDKITQENSLTKEYEGKSLQQVLDFLEIRRQSKLQEVINLLSKDQENYESERTRIVNDINVTYDNLVQNAVAFFDSQN